MYVYQNTGASLGATALKIAWNHKAPYLTLFVTLCVELGPFHNVLDVDGPCGGSIQLQAAPIHTQWRGGAAHGRVLITAAMTPSREWCFSHLQRHICLVLPNLLTQFQWDTGAGIHQYVLRCLRTEFVFIGSLAFPVQWINHCAKSWCSYAVARNIKDTTGLTRTTGDLKNGNRRIYNSCVLVIMGKYYWPIPRQLYVILVYQNFHITCIFIEHAWLMLTDNWHHIMV